MRPSLLVLVVSVALAAVPSATLAKGVVDAQVCGSAGCEPVDAASFHAVVPEGDPIDAAPAAAPFVTLRVRMGHDPGGQPNTERFDYLPSLGVIRPVGATQWIRLYPVQRAALDKLVAPVEPLPASRLTGVAQPASADDGTPWWPLAGAIAAALALLALAARFAKSALKARPHTSKSTN